MLAEIDTQETTYLCTICGAAMLAVEPPKLCASCGADGGEYGFPTAEAVKIAGQNDRFRAGMLKGMDADLRGNIVTTPGIVDRGRGFVTEAFIAVARDTRFTADNDPYGDHGFGTVIVQGEKLFWKIDLYDSELVYGSPAPSDPSQTRRVLTILLPSEY